jgi:hypothetical protein
MDKLRDDMRATKKVRQPDSSVIDGSPSVASPIPRPARRLDD